MFVNKLKYVILCIPFNLPTYMPLSWNEIKTNAIAFVKQWEHETSEDAEAKSFWDSFFEVFGISRYRLASFEKPVKKQDGRQGYIDLLWKGVMLVEHKSKGKDLDRAYRQATDYFVGLKEHELPRYVLVSDFARFKFYDLETDTSHEFALIDLINHLHLFSFMAGYQQHTYQETDLVNIKASTLLGILHENIKEAGYEGYELDMYLVRLVFCMFADDTGIFEKHIFWEFLDKKTDEKGKDFGQQLLIFFDILNLAQEKRVKNTPDYLTHFPYINGGLFEERLRPIFFDANMRDKVLEACALDWGKISPAIFGSMFQAAMNPVERRNLGAHYTSEKNIQKVIRPLFLDELYAEFEQAKLSRGKLEALHTKISNLHFLDPACGCGNFLIITYRELRELELLILRELYKGLLPVEDIGTLLKVNINQFYGIELDGFAVHIAQLAMWLTEHQMNQKCSHELGKYYVRIPLEGTAKIVHGNALEIDWKTVIEPPKPPPVPKPRELYAKGKRKLPKTHPKGFFELDESEIVVPETPKEYHYILGNPPFIGQHLQNETQKRQLNAVLHDITSSGVMDYVSGWFYKAAAYIQGTKIKCAFVSTNSIAQGEQAGILWQKMFDNYKIKIHFAHKTFKWSNEATGNAAVHCIIIGFAHFDIAQKILYDYEDVKSEPTPQIVRNINPYLIPAPDVVVLNKDKSLCNMPEMKYGSKPTDDGNLLFTDEEKIAFLKKEPKASPFIKPFISAKEYLNGEKRWCLWLAGVAPDAYRKLPEVMKRIDAVKKFRGKSIAATTKSYPHDALFRQVTQPNSDYILVPRTTSENRKYIPMSFFSKDNIVSDTCQAIPNGDLYLFGVLMSLMHMSWVRTVCGRLESRFRYSKDVVYNNFPFPIEATEAQRGKVTQCAEAVLQARTLYPNSTLADLYDARTMPVELTKAHNALDRAVDACYRKEAFTNELARIAYLFQLYENLVTLLFAEQAVEEAK